MESKKEYVSPESCVQKIITSHLVCETLSGGGTGGPGIAEAKEREEEEELAEFLSSIENEKEKGKGLW